MITNADVLASQWKQLRGKVKQKWGALTDADLARISGSADVLIGVVQERYGYGQQKAEEEVNRFLREIATGFASEPARVGQSK